METTPLITHPRLSFWSRFKLMWFRKRELKRRYIEIGKHPAEEFPPNNVCNQKFNVITFLPLVLYEQFSFFLNLYFLVMAASQFIRSIRIGYLYTYWGPLCFVIGVTIFREAIDDFRRYRRDKQVNRQKYERIILDRTEEATGYRPYITEEVSSSQIRVGDIVILQKGQRVPADMILLRTNEAKGAVYIRTDQLDGEIDWKLRIPIPLTQKLATDAHLLDVSATIMAEMPEKDIHSFIGTITSADSERPQRLDIENTLWSGCVIASGQATGLVIYTGIETRSVMNNSTPRAKFGRLDLQVNDFTKVLFVAVMLLSLLLMTLRGFSGPWLAFLCRFVLLFSYIIPISLRTNLEMGKVFYSWRIQHDRHIEGTVMRSTNIPEELGRIQYLLTDKTGTLTKNEMVFKKLHFGQALFDQFTFCEIQALLTQYVTQFCVEATSPLEESSVNRPNGVTPARAWASVVALALCHNVTPVYEVNELDDNSSDMTGSIQSESGGGAVPQQQLCDYQASSPDEVALVKWTDMMGISLYKRDLHNISLKLRAANHILEYSILQMFPFTSESKMMGIIVKQEDTNEITYYVKGADIALKNYLDTPWLEGECRTLASEGLRTMVIAKKTLTQEQYDNFENKYQAARVSKDSHNELMAAAMSKLNMNLTFLGLTGVEDRLAEDVPQTLSKLRAAGIKIWMLTGDKLETALCIARSLNLGTDDNWHVEGNVEGRERRENAHAVLERLRERDNLHLIIEGEILEDCLKHYLNESVSLLCACAGVVVARCSPTQKATVVTLLRARGLTVAAVGDGGNDVAMIQEADVGIGIKGLEGRAASLAGDVSARSFSVLSRLVLVHGRRAWMRSAALTLFIVHRGLIISTMQAVFSVVFYFSSVSLYPGFLMVGYGTIYTVLPVFSLVLDRDLPSVTVLMHPQLYKQLSRGRQLSYKTFFIWTAISIYQGAVIMYGALLLFEEQLIHIVEISYSALILTELIMVAITVARWHRLMLAAELLSLSMYTATLLIFTGYFDGDFIRHWNFWWKVTVITLVSCLPLYIVKYTHRKWTNRQYRKLVTTIN